jgi:excisionase family DNA binding protein
MPNQGSAQADGQPVAEQSAYFVAEVAAMLRVDGTTVYREIRAGRLRALRIGSRRGTLRITSDAYAEYVAAAEVTA